MKFLRNYYNNKNKIYKEKIEPLLYTEDDIPTLRKKAEKETLFYKYLLLPQTIVFLVLFDLGVLLMTIIFSYIALITNVFTTKYLLSNVIMLLQIVFLSLIVLLLAVILVIVQISFFTKLFNKSNTEILAHYNRLALKHLKNNKTE